MYQKGLSDPSKVVSVFLSPSPMIPFRLSCKISQMYVPLKNYSVITEFMLPIITGALRCVLNFKWTYIRGFFLKKINMCLDILISKKFS